MTQQTLSADFDKSQADDWWARLVPVNASEETPLLLMAPKEEYIIGRSSNECNFVLGGDLVSSQHCRILKVSDGEDAFMVLMEDLSSNGTFINGIKLGKGNKRMLVSGDEIGITPTGRTFEHHFIFQMTSSRNSDDVHYEVESPSDRMYILQRELGRGNFSVVRLAVNKTTGEKYAIKIIDKRRIAFNVQAEEALKREAEVLKSIDHPYIVRLHEAFQLGHLSYLVMDFISGGDLSNYVSGRDVLREEEVRRLFRQMVEAVQYIHSFGIVHRDLKPENVLVTEDKSPTLKLSDFGLAKMIGSDECHTICGTPEYLAPEVFLSGNYDSRVDLYSLGAILYFMLTGQSPSEVNLETIGVEGSSSSLPKAIPPQAAGLIKGLMQPDPEKRTSLEALIRHPWMLTAPRTPATPHAFRRPEDRPVWATLSSQEGPPRVIKMFRDSISFGRREDNDIVLGDPRVSGTHCKIVREGGHVLLHDTSANGVRVNGILVGKGNSAELRQRDVLTLVPETLHQSAMTFTYAEMLPPSAKRSLSPPDTDEHTRKQQRINSSFTLQSINIPTLPPIIPMKPQMLIGRRPDCDILLNVAEVSSVHCRLTTSNNVTTLEDSSSNGTWVNGTKVGKGNTTVLKDGDEFLIMNPKAADTKIGFRCVFR
ncbi:CAMK protein kinase [Spizellomyces punctatus DAOM BR117]|uniref:CAMK protein kinase n=1 Tax=Spizellomyces punctatus (strain DAOM BR117) TaxID=645134 RepID=A0A0L0HSI2_SPIPD|nr:CAMK protein kinase [Spizellomyces punctatus DAOM BR117]KND04321.1 CAMK protein kinase [Spizellomyces punctatus DAOM BR117]|eukprot:XP_016612360.1 CAMK protein kinase [Spizellomyces punctatus DAOM BR117]